MATWILINIGWGNGLLPNGTKPLPGPILTYCQWGPVAVTFGQFHKRYLSHQSSKSAYKSLIQNVIQISQGPMSWLMCIMIDLFLLLPHAGAAGRKLWHFSIWVIGTERMLLAWHSRQVTLSYKILYDKNKYGIFIMKKTLNYITVTVKIIPITVGVMEQKILSTLEKYRLSFSYGA